MFFKRSENIKKSIFDCGIEINKDSFSELFSASLGKVLVVQNRFGDLIQDEKSWNIDLPKGKIKFGEKSFPIQFLGGESNFSDTWLWGWENINGFDREILEDANKYKKFGVENNLETFSHPQLELDEVINGHNISIVASALSDRNVGYYRAVHANGAVFVLLDNIDNKVFNPVSDFEFIGHVKNAIEQFDINHKIFIASFLYQNDTEFEVSNNEIIATFRNKRKVRFRFETVGQIERLINIENH